MLIAFSSLNLTKQIQICMLYNRTYTSMLTLERIIATKDIQFSHCELSIYMQQHSSLAALAYEENISQLIRYSRAGGSCQNCLDRELLLTRKLLEFEFDNCQHELVTSNRYGIFCHIRTRMCSVCRSHNPILFHDLSPDFQQEYHCE